jgi:hypothetical protein
MLIPALGCDDRQPFFRDYLELIIGTHNNTNQC